MKSKLILITVILLITIGIKASENGLSELSQLKAENFKLKAQLIQCNTAVEQSKLTEQFRRELNAKPEDTFDWNTLTFKPSGQK